MRDQKWCREASLFFMPLALYLRGHMSARSEFNKFVKSLTEDELRQEMKSLYATLKQVKQHYQMELGGDEERRKIFDRAKKDIYNLYFIRNIPRKRPRIAKIKVILKELKKLSVFSHETVDLYLYTTETCLDYLSRRSYTTSATYNSCMDSYEKALEIIDTGLHEDFRDRCKKIASRGGKISELDGVLKEFYDETFG